LKNYIIFNRNL